MTPIYVLAESTEKPLSIEFGEDTVYLRKDIKEESRESMDGNLVKYWTYMEAKMTPAEFNAYANVLTTGNTSELIVSQENVDNNQLVIMEAFTDLYDLIATMI